MAAGDNSDALMTMGKVSEFSLSKDDWNTYIKQL